MCICAYLAGLPFHYIGHTCFVLEPMASSTLLSNSSQTVLRLNYSVDVALLQSGQATALDIVILRRPLLDSLCIFTSCEFSVLCTFVKCFQCSHCKMAWDFMHLYEAVILLSSLDCLSQPDQNGKASYLQAVCMNCSGLISTPSGCSFTSVTLSWLSCGDCFHRYLMVSACLLLTVYLHLLTALLKVSRPTKLQRWHLDLPGFEKSLATWQFVQNNTGSGSCKRQPMLGAAVYT